MPRPEELASPSPRQSPTRELKTLFLARQSQVAPKGVPSAAPYLPQPLHLPVGKLLNAQSLVGHFRFDFTYFFDFQEERLDSCQNRERPQVPIPRKLPPVIRILAPGREPAAQPAAPILPSEAEMSPPPWDPPFVKVAYST